MDVYMTTILAMTFLGRTDWRSILHFCIAREIKQRWIASCH